MLAQTYKDFELIVVDDGSTDGTKGVVLACGSRIKYIYQDNRGPSAARNTGILAAKGEYVTFLDADDAWLPGKLELEVQFLDAHPSIGMVYSDYTYFGTRPAPRKSGFEGVSLPSGHILKELFLSNPISSSAVLVRKACFEKVGLFDESLVSCEDLDMWLRIARYFEIDYIDVPLARYRFHERNTHLDSEGQLLGGFAVRRKCLRSNKLLLNEVDAGKMYKRYYSWFYQVGVRHLSGGVPKRAREMFRQCIGLYPHDPAAYIMWLMTFLPSRLGSGMLTYWQRMIAYLATKKQSFSRMLFPS
ncbi:MAG: glycosyltransferase [Chloroflexi bacterium]|nr:glycosyltransferase [Chloroflexota bacterium]